MDNLHLSSYLLHMVISILQNKQEGLSDTKTDLNAGINGTYEEHIGEDNKDADEHAQH